MTPSLEVIFDYMRVVPLGLMDNWASHGAELVFVFNNTRFNGPLEWREANPFYVHRGRAAIVEQDAIIMAWYCRHWHPVTNWLAAIQQHRQRGWQNSETLFTLEPSFGWVEASRLCILGCTRARQHLVSSIVPTCRERIVEARIQSFHDRALL